MCPSAGWECGRALEWTPLAGECKGGPVNCRGDLQRPKDFRVPPHLRGTGGIRGVSRRCVGRRRTGDRYRRGGWLVDRTFDPHWKLSQEKESEVKVREGKSGVEFGRRDRGTV